MSVNCLVILICEIERLKPYVEAFRREETRADKLGAEVDELRECVQYLLGLLDRHVVERVMDEQEAGHLRQLKAKGLWH